MEDWKKREDRHREDGHMGRDEEDSSVCCSDS